MSSRNRRLIPLPDRIRRMSAIDPESGCWMWQGRPGTHGYGQMSVRPAPHTAPATLLAHRVSYETFVGSIPEGLVIDHLCRTRLCVNPAHMEPVTPRENVMRSPIAVAAINAAKTQCPQGHEYTAANTIWQTHKNGTTRGRLCRACQAVHAKRRTAVPA